MQPVIEAKRIQSLDVLRGFALLGILLLNILGFGLVSASYSNAGFDLIGASGVNVITWASVELFAEGAMRCLFSILFGAGIVLFTTGARGKSAGLHYKRTFWLLIFGLFDAYILLWNGDILITYAISGAILYFARNFSAKTLLIITGVLLVLMSAFYGLAGYGLGKAFSAAQLVDQAEDPSKINPDVLDAAKQWKSFESDFQPSPSQVKDELSQRRDSYLSAFKWNVDVVSKMLLFVLPVYLIWDALAMMLLGMALYKADILQGGKSTAFYFKLMAIGFFIGFGINAYEVSNSLAGALSLPSTFAQMQWTYHIGRLGVAMGYIGLIVLMIHKAYMHRLLDMLASVGRMALTNYLMQSLICAILFTGLGFSLVGYMTRAELYIVVFAIWVFQLLLSHWWLKKFQFGPVEWLWRALTYGEKPVFIRRTV